MIKNFLYALLEVTLHTKQDEPIEIFFNVFLYFIVIYNSYVWIVARHPVILSELIDYDNDLFYKNWLF